MLLGLSGASGLYPIPSSPQFNNTHVYTTTSVPENPDVTRTPKGSDNQPARLPTNIPTKMPMTMSMNEPTKIPTTIPRNEPTKMLTAMLMNEPSQGISQQMLHQRLNYKPYPAERDYTLLIHSTN